MLSIALVHAGLVPTKISALGIEFDQSGQDALLWLVALVVGYYMGAFIVYGLSDFALWRHQFHEASISETETRRKEIISINCSEPGELDEEHLLTKNEAREISGRFSAAYSGRYKWRLILPFISISRALFDFVLPLVVAAYALFVLVFR